jgi:protease I
MHYQLVLVCSAVKDNIVNAGAEFIDDEVVVDGNIVTSRDPYDLPAFCREVIKLLKTA